MQNNSERKQFIDCSKGIAIIIVVIVHSLSNQVDLTMASHARIICFLTQFAMPTFFFINGFLYNSKYSKQPIVGSIKKFRAYYVPFLKYNLIFLVLHNIFAYLHMVDEYNGNLAYSAKDYFKHFILVLTGHREYFGGALWFLGSILTVSIIFIFSDYFTNKYLSKYRYIVLTVIVFIFALLGKSGYVPNAMKLSVSCTYLAFFYIGYLFAQFDLLGKIENYKWIFIVVSIVVLVIAANISYLGIYQTIFDVWFYYIIATMGATSVLLISKLGCVENCKAINYIGKASMEIMAFHLMSFKLVSFIIIKVNDISIDRLAEYPVLTGVSKGWPLLYIIVGVSIPVGIKYIKDLIKRSINHG